MFTTAAQQTFQIFLRDTFAPKFPSNTHASDEVRLEAGWIQQLAYNGATPPIKDHKQEVEGYKVAPYPAGHWRYVGETGEQAIWMRWLQPVR